MVQRLLGTWGRLDPQMAGSQDSSQITMGLYDTLLALVDGKVVPYLATSWSQTPTSVKFTLRRDATCSDGTPVTATVVADSFRRLLITNAAKSATQLAAFGPGPYAVTADDSTATVTVSIGRPFSGLIYAFTQPVGSAAIICPAGISNSASLDTKPAGSGPFTLESILAGDTATLVARSDWHWGPNGLTTKSPGFPQKIVYKVVVNDTTAANLLITGGLDVAVINGVDNARLASESSLLHRAAHGFFATEIIFNQSEGRPTADQTVRQALTTAIDTVAFGKATYYAGTPTTSFLAPDARCFDPSTKALLPKGDPAKAKQVMTDGGYQLGSDGKFRDKSGKLVTINLAAGVHHNTGPDYLTSQFEAAGFDVKLNKTDAGSFARAYLSGNFDVTISQGPADTPDPNGSGLLGLYSGTPAPTGANATRKDYSNIDSEIAAANASSGAESCKHWAAVQQELLKRFIILPTVAVDYQWYGRGILLNGLQSRSIDPLFLKRVR